MGNSQSVWLAKPSFYFRGLSLNLVRVVPHFVIVMWITELLTPNK